MIRVENIETYGFEAAIRGMRNPMNSWDKSDSRLCKRNTDDCYVNPACDCPKDGCFDEDYFCIGHNDLDLMKRLFRAGTEHRKYLRMITVTMDIVAPLYWWKEMDQYRIGTTTNSCSTMHKIHAKEFTAEDFSCEHLNNWGLSLLYEMIKILNVFRQNYNITKDKDWWWNMIQILPTSYNQRRTVQINYETVFNIIKQRENHKLDEWVQFVDILKQLPYVGEILI